MLVAVSAVALAAGGSVGAQTSSLSIDGAWARPTPPGASNAAVYMVVTVSRDDRLVGVTVPEALAGSAVLHVAAGARSKGSRAGHRGDHGGAGGAPASRTMAGVDGIPLPAGSPYAFAPGRAHIMVADLRAPLIAGTSFPLTLEFARHPLRTVSVEVRTNPRRGMGAERG